MGYDVCKIIQAKFITTKQGLVCLGTALQRVGKQCLAQLIANRGHKSVDEALASAKKLSAAELLLERFKTREYNFYKGRKIVNVFRDGEQNDTRWLFGFWKTKKSCDRFCLQRCIMPSPKEKENAAKCMYMEPQTVARTLFCYP